MQNSHSILSKHGHSFQFLKVGTKEKILGCILIFSVTVEFIEPAAAAHPSCHGKSCNDRNPIEYRCNSDARVAQELTKTVHRWQDAGQPQQIVIQQIYSELCNANWVKAYVPDNAFLYIQERDLVNGTQPIHGLTKAEGTGYFWVEGKMSNGDVANQACVALPIFSNENGYNLYDRYCTNSPEN